MTELRERSYVQDRMTVNRRLIRANVVAHNVLNVLEPWIDRLESLSQANTIRRGGELRDVPDYRRHIFNALLDTLTAQGIEVITDADRRWAGLPPRDHNGMTGLELAILENERVRTLLEPTVMAPGEILKDTPFGRPDGIVEWPDDLKKREIDG